ERRDADDDLQAENVRANPFEAPPHEPGAVLGRPAVLSVAAARAEQLVAKISVARLHVLELDPAVACEAGRGYEVVDQPIELLVRENADGSWKASIEQRLRRSRERRRPVVRIRPREPARVRQLQPDEQNRI